MLGLILGSVSAGVIGLLLLVILIDFKDRFTRNRNIAGHHVLITGGSSGIGKEIGCLAASKGSNVTILARSSSKLESAASDIRGKCVSSNQKINSYPVDVTKFDKLEEVINRAEIDVGPVDILINCAGYAYASRLEEIPLEHIKGMMDVNYMGTVHAIKCILPSMKSRRKGKIAIVSSIAGMFGLFGYSGYSASKFALRGLAESLQMEVRPFNISITLAFPPDTDTPGFSEENKTKPLETKLIGDTAGVLQPNVVGKKIFEDTLMGDFFSAYGLDGTVATIICAGMSPMSSLLGAVAQVLFQGPLRIVSLGYVYHFNRIVQKCALNKERQKKAE